MYNLKLDGLWYHLRGNKKTGEIFNFSLKSNRNAPLRPKSAIYTLKRDFEHPGHFFTEVLPGNKIRQNKEMNMILSVKYY